MSHAAPPRSIERQHLADTEKKLAEATAVLDRLNQLHGPKRIYDECDHHHTQADVDEGRVVELAYGGIACDETYLYTVCRHCCTDAEGIQTEECAADHAHRDGLPACPTAAILGGAR